MGTQQFCLRWNNHQSNLLNVFEELLNDETLVDVTLACEGLCVRAHKVVLSACSPYFKELFVHNPCKHPIVILKDTTFAQMRAIIDFMYRGEVNISHDQLPAFLKTAETLKVKGLAQVRNEQRTGEGDGDFDEPQPVPPAPHRDEEASERSCGSPPAKRKRVRGGRNSPSGSVGEKSSDGDGGSAVPSVPVSGEKRGGSGGSGGGGGSSGEPLAILPEVIKVEAGETSGSCSMGDEVRVEEMPAMMERGSMSVTVSNQEVGILTVVGVWLDLVVEGFKRFYEQLFSVV